MDRPLVCPMCLSRFADIRGMVYADGGPVGRQCDDAWHDGEKYNELKLSESDKEFFRINGLGL